MIELFLRWMSKEWEPYQREHAKALVKHLPWYRRGGPKRKKMPDDEGCRQICKEIFDEQRKTGSIGVAQRNVALKRRLNIRMVQRIKARCQELFAAQDKRKNE
jgi:hypothetical protein